MFSNNQHHAKTKRTGGSHKSANSLSSPLNASFLSDTTSSSDNSQNTSLSDFLSPSSPLFSQTPKELPHPNSLDSNSDTYNNVNTTPTHNTCSLNSLLFTKLAKTTDNSYPLEFETLEIKAHKFILASRSGKFRELLKTNLIKICSLTNRNVPVFSCDQCKSRSSISDTAAAGCSSANCLYKNKNSTFSNSLELSRVASGNKSNGGSSTTGVNAASSAAEASQILCSSSYPSCSTTSSSSSSASNSQEECTCCTCPK